MILINKEDELTTVVLSPINGTYQLFKLTLYSDYTKKQYTLNLGENYSDVVKRYTKFVINDEQIQYYETGEYNYTFLGDTNVLSNGLFLLKDNRDKKVYQSIVPPVEDNDFYVVQTI
jgi:hypothetical protein